MLSIKRLSILVALGCALVGGTARGTMSAHAVTCSGTASSPGVSGSQVWGRGSDTCSFTVCLEATSQTSGWSGPFNCVAYGPGSGTSSHYNGCGQGLFFRTAIHDAAMPANVYVAGPDLNC